MADEVPGVESVMVDKTNNEVPALTELKPGEDEKHVDAHWERRETNMAERLPGLCLSIC